MHFNLFVTSCILLTFTLVANYIRSRTLSISLIDSLVRPSQIILGYMLCFLSLGSLFFYYERVLSARLIVESYYWNPWPIVIMAGTLLSTILVTNTVRIGVATSRSTAPQYRKQFPWELLALCLALVAAALDSASVVLLSTSLYIAGAANGRLKSPLFLTLFTVGIATLLPMFAFGKRLLIFPIIVVLMIAWRNGEIRQRTAALFFIGCILVILPLSIIRGYGNFSADNFIDAINNVFNYISKDYFLSAFGNNIEATYFYFHGINSLQITFQTSNYLWGETILKMLFLGSRLYGFEDGLSSSIHIYTSAYDSDFRAIGGSYPIMLISEFFMNFGVFMLLIFPLFLLALDALSRRIRTISSGTVRFSLEAILLYSSILLARGSSFDLFLYHLILLGAPIMTLVWGAEMIKRPRTRTTKRAAVTSNYADHQ
jgi:hypothetical protein